MTQLYRGPLFLRGFDSDIRAHAAQEIAKTGVDLRFEINVRASSIIGYVGAGGLGPEGEAGRCGFTPP